MKITTYKALALHIALGTYKGKGYMGKGKNVSEAIINCLIKMPYA